MPLLSGRTPARAAALWVFLGHGAAAIWIWSRWPGGVRGGILFWMDLPVSLLYAGVPGRLFLATSVVLGGLWWSAVAAGLTRLVGRFAAGGPTKADRPGR